MEIEIRQEIPEDQDRVYEIEAAAFGSRIQPDLVNVLRQSAKPMLSLISMLNGALVGHILFTPVTFDTDPAGLACQLSPIAIDPRYQKRGIGGDLIREGLGRCQSLGWSSVFLVGNPIYYSRFGFQMAAPLGFSIDGPHNPYLQVIELQMGALKSLSGQVSFHPAFDLIGD